MPTLNLKPYFPLLLVVLLGAFLRLYQLGNIPAGFTWDEAAITYDAWGIHDWHRDQYATFMPLVFKSFGDYKAPFLHYLLATTFFVTGPQEITIRLVSALAGISLIFISFGITQQLFPKQKELPFITALLVSLSPWSIHMSRIGFEANLAVTFNALGVWFFLLIRRSPWFLYASLASFAAALYSYQSSKITIPLMLLLMVWFSKKAHLNLSKKHLVLALATIVLLIAPFIYSLKQGGVERGKQALVFYQNNQLSLNSQTLLKLVANTAKHLHPNFLFLGIQDNHRNITPGYGITYWLLVPMLIIGCFQLMKSQDTKGKLLLSWLIIGLMPSIIGKPSPHTIRASSIMPAIQIIEALGLVTYIKYALRRFKSVTSRQAYMLVYPLITGLGLNIFVFLFNYFADHPSNDSTDFQYGYEQAVQAIKEHGRDVSHIYFTDAYQQPYIYVLLYRRITPEEFQAGALANMSFHGLNWPTDKTDALFIGTAEEIPPNDPNVIEVIYYPGSEKITFVVAKKS